MNKKSKKTFFFCSCIDISFGTIKRRTLMQIHKRSLNAKYIKYILFHIH